MGTAGNIARLRRDRCPCPLADDLEPYLQQGYLVAKMRHLQGSLRPCQFRLEPLMRQMLFQNFVHQGLYPFIVHDERLEQFVGFDLFGQCTLLCHRKTPIRCRKFPRTILETPKVRRNHKRGIGLNIRPIAALISTLTTVNQMNPTQQRSNFRANTSQSDADVLSEARDLVDQFLLYLKDADLGLDVVDVDDLPFRKPLLVNAIRLLIATDASPLTRQQLRKVGLTLACFQEDIGQRMSIRPVSGESALSDADVAEMMTQHRHHIQRFDRAFSIMTTERRLLDELFQTSMRMAERREARTSGTRSRASDVNDAYAAHH